jgi:hypothetical protein
MNEALCDFCKPLFEGGVDGNDENDSVKVLVVKRELLHHKSTQDLHDCAQAECLLCAAVWNSVPRKLGASWLAADSEVREEGRKDAAHLDTQVRFRVTFKWPRMERKSWQLSIKAWNAPEADYVECLFNLAGRFLVRPSTCQCHESMLPEAENGTYKQTEPTTFMAAVPRRSRRAKPTQHHPQQQWQWLYLGCKLVTRAITSAKRRNPVRRGQRDSFTWVDKDGSRASF